ncbi:UNKNOWN [Stylonychia lemnae]|uniref:Uncharacterized protein n=1 Tax=Stylonychia lemnae TaxID=5949 RepID=A0A078A567_STYLE|nr:UNKNOWN [Stylonychia lemnae]|eukprot:CDW75889.1 UNKNOWN [Stylonychia lemnae]
MLGQKFEFIQRNGQRINLICELAMCRFRNVLKLQQKLSVQSYPIIPFVSGKDLKLTEIYYYVQNSHRHIYHNFHPMDNITPESRVTPIKSQMLHRETEQGEISTLNTLIQNQTVAEYPIFIPDIGSERSQLLITSEYGS